MKYSRVTRRQYSSLLSQHQVNTPPTQLKKKKENSEGESLLDSGLMILALPPPAPPRPAPPQQAPPRRGELRQQLGTRGMSGLPLEY